MDGDIHVRNDTPQSWLQIMSNFEIDSLLSPPDVIETDTIMDRPGSNHEVAHKVRLVENLFQGRRQL